MGEWLEKRMEEIAEFNPRETIKKGTIAKKIAMDKIQPFCRDVPGFEMEAFSGGTKFRNGDTIMARITPCLENGKTARVDILDDGEVGFGSTEFIVFRAKDGYDPDFLYYLVTSPVVREPAIKSMVGSSGRQRVQTDVVQQLKIMVPDLQEQQAIGGLLRSLDDKIAANRMINENLLQQAQALFISWFVDYEPFGGIMPDDWKAISVYDLADYINGAAFKKNEYSDTGLPIIKIAELKNGITDSTQRCCVKKDDKYYIDDRDILFSWSGNPDTSIDTFIWSMGRAILNQHTFRVVSKYDAPAFTFFLLKYLKPQFTHIASNKQTTGLGHVTVADLKRLQFTSNANVISEFNTLVMPMFNLIFSNYKEIQQLSVLRDTLLPQLMSGELDVSDLDV